MKRWLFNLAAAVSMLIFMATSVVWIRSYFVADLFKWENSNKLRGVATSFPLWTSHIVVGAARGYTFASWTYNEWDTNQGLIFGPYYLHSKGNAATYPVHYIPWYGMKANFELRVAGLSFTFVDQILNLQPQRAKAITIPMYAIECGSLTLPLLWLRRARRHLLNKTSGYCSVCGYDLRATPDRCPECGTVPTKKPATSAK